VRVLLALAADPSRWRHGYELLGETGLQSGALYPILMRLADRELLEAEWESDAPAGRPPRHLYRLTADGRALAETIEQARVPRQRSGAVHLRGAS
jgi:PadR family transcriptional regulator